MVESGDAKEEQHPGVSVGLICLQDSLLEVPNPTQHCSWFPQRTGTSAPRPHRVPHQLLLDSPGMLCSAPEGTQSCGTSPEPGSAQSRAALCPSSCLVHPSEGSRDQDKPRKVTLDEAAHVAAEVEPLRPAEIQKSCNTPNTSTSPVATALSQTQGCREGREPLGNVSHV